MDVCMDLRNIGQGETKRAGKARERGGGRGEKRRGRSVQQRGIRMTLHARDERSKKTMTCAIWEGGSGVKRRGVTVGGSTRLAAWTDASESELTRPSRARQTVR